LVGNDVVDAIHELRRKIFRLTAFIATFFSFPATSSWPADTADWNPISGADFPHHFASPQVAGHKDNSLLETDLGVVPQPQGFPGRAGPSISRAMEGAAFSISSNSTSDSPQLSRWPRK